MVDKSIVQEWLQKAESDFCFAEDALEDSQYFEQICFLFQQAAEKYLKALIIASELPFKKIHDLGVLLEILKEKYPTAHELKEACDFLTSFYVEARYPGFPSKTITKETAERAKSAVKKIAEFVEIHIQY